MVQRLTLLAALLASTAAFGQELPNHSVAVGGGPGFAGFRSVGPCPANQVLGWTSSTQDPVCLTGGGGGGGGVSSINGIVGPISLVAGTNVTIVPGSPNAQSITISSTGGGGGGFDCSQLSLTGDVTSVHSCATALATVNSTTGTYGAANAVAQITVNGKGLVTNVAPVAISIPFTSVIGTIGCAQMPTITGDVGSAGATCNLTLGAGVVTNAKMANMPAATLKGNPTNASAGPTDFKLTDLPNKPVPTPATDSMLIYDSTAGTLKYCLLNQCITGGGTAGVTSLNTLTGALNLTGAGGITITPSGANIQIGFGATTNPTTTIIAGAGTCVPAGNCSGSTYSVPTGVVWIEVYAIGGGAGGQGGGVSPGAGTSGGSTSLAGIAVVNGGTNGGGGGAGGSPPTCATQGFFGGGGDGGSLSLSGQFNGKGGMGGAGYWGGGGAGNYNTAGNSANAYGAGGGGGSAGSTATALGGQGGGAGGFCYALVRSGLSATYAFTIGAAGTGGTAGTGGGTAAGNGQAGLILVKEHYTAGGGSGGGGTAGVTSLNTLTGPLTIVAGSGIAVSQAGSTITVTNSAAAPTVFTTGDIKPTVKTVADSGWVMLGNDAASIGDASSAATVLRDASAQSLFNLLWSVCPSDCTLSPGGRGPDATTDWNAHKAILLPKTGGRSMGGAGQIGTTGTTRAIGSTFGGEQTSLPTYSLSVSGSHTITVGEMPDHSHATDAQYPWELIFYYAGGGGPYNNWDVLPGTGNQSFTGGAGPKEVGHTGGGGAFSMSSTGTGTPNAGLQMFEPAAWVNWMIKL